MMLDPSLGKILSSKPVEPSITNNVDHNPGDNETTTTSATTLENTEKNLNTHSSNSEAEVRLVVRFFVEEHIVYNGRIEKIKQLESEELSRLVSRIAWDGANGERKPVVADNILNEKHQGCADHIDIPPELCKSSKIPHHDHDSAAQIEFSLGGSIRNHKDEDATEDHSKSIFVNPCNSTSVPIYETTGANIPEVALKSPTTSVNLLCDNEPAIYNHICETGNPLERSCNNIQENFGEDKLLQEVKLYSTQEHESLSSPIDDMKIENADRQTIVDTIYDCVCSVEMESRREQESLEINGCSFKKETEHRSIKDEVVNNDSINEISSNDCTSSTKHLIAGKHIPSCNRPTQASIPLRSDNIEQEIDEAQVTQAGTNDLTPKIVSTKIPDNGDSCSTKRKIVHDNGTTTKRIRRISSKDQRNYRSTNRTSENLINQQSAIFTTAIASEDDGQFVRFSKVFAKWSDNHFYPGTILKSSRDRKFEIGFFDGARKDVAESDLIPSTNILRKQVRVSIAKDYCVNAIVHEQLSHNGQLMFDVEYQQNGLVRKSVPLGDIFLTAEQGIPLINQTIRQDKKPDESMFAGVDLDNIVHVKRSRRLQEMEESEVGDECTVNPSNTTNGGRRKRGQYNMRSITNRVRAGNRVEMHSERVIKRSLTDINNPDTPTSSCSPDKATPDSPGLSSPSEGSCSRDASKF